MISARISTMFLAGAVAACCSMTGCDKPVQVDRAGKLLAMAGEEAAGITNTLDRFTRQLNVADTELRTNRKADAAATLALARDTLTASKKEDFDDFHRIAGWTAISQLSRAAGDRDLAMKSSDNAMAALNGVLPVVNRPQYVMSLSRELADLRGKEAAIELLESGSAWAAEIHDADTRRLALITFAQALLTYDAFENARSTLRRDPDAAWRTDTFLALANMAAPIANDVGYASAAPAPGMEAEAQMRSARGGSGRGGFAGNVATPANSQASFQEQIRKADSFNKDVRFENVYKQN